MPEDEFGFTISRVADWDDPAYVAALARFKADHGREFGWWSQADAPRPPVRDEWRVSLPHHCDAWPITPEYEGVPHAEAVAALERFIAEAQDALERLKRHEADDS